MKYESSLLIMFLIMSLFEAIRRNDLILLEKPLQKPNFDINRIYANESFTPLQYAILCDRVKIVQLLLENKANVNTITAEYGYTPLHYAVHQNINILKILLEYGADINYRNRFGWTVLHRVCNVEFLDKIELLLNWGADHTLTTYDNQSIYDLSKRKTIKFIYFCLLRKELWNLWELNECDSVNK